MQYFHFTIGPVQSFVSQARRTRDFWAGSFLLSWLSGVAMLSVKKQGGKIIFPKADENYLNWIEGNGSGEKPRQGGIPNRFKAKVNDDFDPKYVVKNINKAWKELADLVWDKDLAELLKKTDIKKQIWDRQIESFWEISWILTEDDEDSDLLDRRKNWRNHFTTEEPGIKCMMMSGWQELSGVLKPDSEKIEIFWQPICEKTGLDLREGEHLCAIAFVKRRFARHFRKLNKPNDPKAEKSCNRYKKQISDDKNLIQAMGWEVENKIPSISYMAVVRWLEKVIEIEDKEKLYSFIEVAKEAIEKGIVEKGEWYTNIHCIKQAADNELQDLISLDGQVFFVNELHNYINKLQRNKDKLEKEKSPQPAIDELISKINILESMIDKLNSIIDIIKESPSPFYAILMMDGDSLGSKMGNPNNQQLISQALEQFTKLVSTIVSKNSGFLIYAGGDDVLAVLPVENVFNCAIQIRVFYQKCFQATNNKEIKNSTISAAVEFAHMKTPLTKMLRDAHRLLDNVAKDGCGRDSVAVRVWKPGGTAVQWAMPWECALNGDKLILEEIADTFRIHDEKESGFTNNFFYKIRERFEFLNPAKGEQPILDEDQQCKLLMVDYINAGNNKKLNLETIAEKEVRDLLEQCRRYKRDIDEPDIKKWQDENRKIYVDGALLIRFLVNKGVEKND